MSFVEVRGLGWLLYAMLVVALLSVVYVAASILDYVLEIVEQVCLEDE